MFKANSLKLWSLMQSISDRLGNSIPYGAKILCIVLMISGCSKEISNLANEPVIKLEFLESIKTEEGKDSLVNLKISFQDGDGDVGLTEDDSFPPFNFGNEFHYNLTAEYFVKQGNDFVPLEFMGEPFIQGFRTPDLTPPGKDKTLLGDIEISLQPNIGGLAPQELLFKVQLTDRSLNRSNILVTPSIKLVH